MAIELKPAEERAWTAFLDAQAALLRQLEAELVEKADMTLAEFDVLIQLKNAPHGRLRMTELSERVHRLHDQLVLVVLDRVEPDRRDVVDRAAEAVRLRDRGGTRVVSQGYEPLLREGDRVRVFGTQLELANL